jgi:riboflavin synthase
VFTGIVAGMGTVRRLTRRGDGAQLEIGADLDLDDVRIGDSICVSGVCLTATALGGFVFSADVSAETFSRTTLNSTGAGDRVNLEPALRLGDRLGGHMVLGHVDGVGKILEKTSRSGSVVFGFEVDPGLGRYIVAKGSIAVDGISLTVNHCGKNRFYVNIIPHTAAGTTLGFKAVSDSVNVETDILARYLEKLIFAGKETGNGTADKKDAAGGIDLDLLARHGFIK